MDLTEQIIELLFDNMKDKSNTIDISSRKTLLEMTNKSLDKIINVSIKIFQQIINDISSNDVLNEWLESYVILISDILDKSIKNKAEFCHFEKLLDFILVNIKESFAYNENDKSHQIKKERIAILIRLIPSLSSNELKVVISKILSLFITGQSPNKIVINILISLAKEFKNQVLFNFTEVISKLLPILSTINDESSKSLYCNLFSYIAEGIITSLEDENLNKQVVKIHLDAVSPLFKTIFDLLNSQWILTYKSKTIINTCILISTIISSNESTVLGLISTNLKKESLSESSYLINSFKKYLELTCTETVSIDSNTILSLLFPFISSPQISPNVKEFNADYNKIKSEILQIFKLILSEKTILFLLTKIDSNNSNDKLSAIYCLKALMLSSKDYFCVDKVLISITKCTHETDPELKYAVIETLYVLFQKNLIKSDSSNRLLTYLIKESSINLNNSEKELYSNSTYPFTTSNKTNKERSEYVLMEVSILFPSLYFPFIFDMICDDKYNSSTNIISRLVLCCFPKIDSSELNVKCNYKLLIKLMEINSIPLFKMLLKFIHNDFDVLTSTDYSIDKILNCIVDTTLYNNLISTSLDNLKAVTSNKKSSLIRVIGHIIAHSKDNTINNVDTLMSICYPEYKNNTVDANITPTIIDKETKVSIADAFGYIAKLDLDLILDKTTAILKSQIKYNKPTGFSALFSSPKENLVLSNEIKSQIIFCLGRIATNSKVEMLSSRLDTYFLSQIDLLFSSESVIIKESCVYAYHCIFSSLERLSSSYLGSELFILKNRELYINNMIDLFKQSKRAVFKAEVLLCISSLIQLDPPLDVKMIKDILDLGFSLVNDENNDIIAPFNSLIKACLSHESYISNNELFSNWDMFNYLLNTIIAKEHYALVEAVLFNKKVMTFNNQKEKNNWIDAIVMLISVNNKINITIIISRLLTSINLFDLTIDSNESDLVREIVKGFKDFSNDNITYFINQLLKNTENSVSLQIIKQLIQSKEDLNTSEILRLITNKSSLSNELLDITDTITNTNLDGLIKICLDDKLSLPFTICLSLVIQKTSKNEIKLKKILSIITDIINNESPGVDDKPNYEVSACTLILGVILQDLNDKESKVFEVIRKFFPQLLSTLILRVGSMHSINYSKGIFQSNEEDPRNQTVWTLQNLMKFSNFEIAIDDIQKRLLLCREYDEGIYELMLIVCSRLSFDNQLAMFEFMKDFLDRSWNGQRVVVITCISQFVYNLNVLKENKEIRDSLTIELIKGLSDPDEFARKMSIRGLGNLTKVYLDACNNIDKEEEKLDLKKVVLDETYDNSLKYIIDKISDSSECVVIESLKTLSYIVEYLSLKALLPFMTTLLSKIRPTFDHSNFTIRQFGFYLYNTIISLLEIKDLDQRLTQIIIDQAKVNLVSLLLHICDESILVRKNAIKCLSSCLRNVYHHEMEINEIKDDNLDYYEEVITKVIKLMNDDKNHHLVNTMNHQQSSQENINLTNQIMKI